MVQPDKAIIINTQKPNEKIEIGVLSSRSSEMIVRLSSAMNTMNPTPSFPLFLPSSRRAWPARHGRRMCAASPSTKSRGARPASCRDRRPWSAASSLLQAKDFAKAHDEFRVAVNFLPDALTTAAEHDAAVAGFCESGVKLAEQRIAEGKYGEAEQIVREMVSDRYDPNCRPALELLAHLSEPGYFNKTIGPKFIAKVEEVKKLLSDAEGYYNSGRYDLAFKKYEQVLNLDPYNVAARRGEERINLTQDALWRGGLQRNPLAQALAGAERLGRTGPPIRPDGRPDQ